MSRLLQTLFITFFIGCASGVPTGVVEQAQLEPDSVAWRAFQLKFVDERLAVIYVIGSRDLGAYEANTEYWFVNRSSLSRLGRESLFISVADQYTAEPPTPDLGQVDPPEPDLVGAELSNLGQVDPPEPDLQMFTQPVYPTQGWGEAWEQDPMKGGTFFQSDDLGLRLFADGENGITRVIWYQTLEKRGSPQNITPSGIFSLGDEMKVSSGFVGYSIDLEVQ
jgi:hypothetical protein